MTDLSPRALAARDLLRSATLTDDEREIAERCEKATMEWGSRGAYMTCVHLALDDIPALLTKLTLLRAQYAEAGWRAENTAPKDGTHVLVAVGDNPPFVSEAYYEEDGDRGWYQANTHWTDQHDGSLFPVVAWQPLPQPPLLPAGKEAAGQGVAPSSNDTPSHNDEKN